MPEGKWSFRCRRCGRLHTSDDAAELAHPAACRVCGAGVIFRHQELAARLTEPGADVAALAAEIMKCDPATKTLDPSNWERLAGATPEDLATIGLAPEHVAAHTPWERGEVPERHRAKHFGAPAAPREPGGPPRHVAAGAADGAAGQDSAGGETSRDQAP